MNDLSGSNINATKDAVTKYLQNELSVPLLEYKLLIDMNYEIYSEYKNINTLLEEFYKSMRENQVSEYSKGIHDINEQCHQILNDFKAMDKQAIKLRGYMKELRARVERQRKPK